MRRYGSKQNDFIITHSIKKIIGKYDDMFETFCKVQRRLERKRARRNAKKDILNYE